MDRTPKSQLRPPPSVSTPTCRPRDSTTRTRPDPRPRTAWPRDRPPRTTETSAPAARYGRPAAATTSQGARLRTRSRPTPPIQSTSPEALRTHRAPVAPRIAVLVWRFGRPRSAHPWRRDDPAGQLVVPSQFSSVLLVIGTKLPVAGLPPAVRANLPDHPIPSQRSALTPHNQDQHLPDAPPCIGSVTRRVAAEHWTAAVRCR